MAPTASGSGSPEDGRKKQDWEMGHWSNKVGKNKKPEKTDPKKVAFGLEKQAQGSGVETTKVPGIRVSSAQPKTPSAPPKKPGLRPSKGPMDTPSTGPGMLGSPMQPFPPKAGGPGHQFGPRDNIPGLQPVAPGPSTTLPQQRGPSTAPTVPIILQGPFPIVDPPPVVETTSPEQGYGYPYYPTKQGPLRYQHSTTNPREGPLQGRFTKLDPKMKPSDYPWLGAEPKSPKSDSSAEIIHAANYDVNPFIVDAEDANAIFRRDLIREFVDFKMTNETTGYPVAESHTPWAQPGDFMPTPAPGKKHPERRRSTGMDVDADYPGREVGEYEMFRGGKRDRWPDREWTEDDIAAIAALDLEPNHEPTSTLEWGSPQELNLLSPGMKALGAKIKKSPWDDRHKLAKHNAAAATPKMIVPEKYSPKDHTGPQRLKTAYEHGFWRPILQDNDFPPEWHESRQELSQQLLTEEDAKDIEEYGRIREDVRPERRRPPALSRQEQVKRHMEWEKQFKVRPSSKVEDDNEDEAPLLVSGTDTPKPRYVLQQPPILKEMARQRKRRKAQDRAEREERARDLGVPVEESEDELGRTKADIAAQFDEMPGVETESPSEETPKAKMVLSGSTLAGNNREYDDAPTTPSDGNDGGEQPGQEPDYRICIPCRALGFDCTGHYPCFQCVRDRVPCSFPEAPVRPGGNIWETPSPTGRRGPPPGPGTAGSIDSNDISSDEEDDQDSGDDMPGSPPPRVEPHRNEFADGIVGLPATEHWAANGPPEVGDGPNLGPCDHCIATDSTEKCKPNHDLQLECAACAGARVRGDLGHQCVVRNVVYHPRRHVATRNRYRTIPDAIVYRCDECDKNNVHVCDVDPFVRTGCSSCARTGKECSWHVDRRRAPNAPGNVLVMMPRPPLRENNNVGILRLTPWWRRSCLACIHRGMKCSWLYDYRTIGYRCAGCAHQNEMDPCIDAEAPNLRYHRLLDIDGRIFHHGPRIFDPEVIPRLFVPGSRRGACRTCSVIANTPGACGEEHLQCHGWTGANGYACLRCTALGLPCVANYNRPDSELPAILPYVDRELIGYGAGYSADDMTFPACKHCVEINLWCDRMRPCYECKIRDLDCEIDRRIGAGLGLIPRDEFEDMGIELRPDYWMAHGYASEGPRSDRSRIETGEIAGPVELVWASYGTDNDISIAGEEPPLRRSIIRQRESTSSIVAANAPVIPEAPQPGSSPASVMTFKTWSPPGPGMSLDPNVVQPELPNEPWTPEERRMSGFINGWRQYPKMLVNGVVVRDPTPLPPGAISFVNTPRPSDSRPPMPTIREDFNSDSDDFNVGQPDRGNIIGNNLDPFVVPQDAAGRVAHHDNNFMRQLAAQGPIDGTTASGRDIWSDVAELAGLLPEERFAQGHLNIHEGRSLGLVPDGRQAPVRERVLLTLEGRDAAAITAQNPFVSPPDRDDMDGRAALAKHLMSTWASPGIDVLRDIPDDPDMLPLPKEHNLCKDHGFASDKNPCSSQLSRSGPSHCENRQHINGQNPHAIKPMYVCRACDATTTSHILVGRNGLTAKDFRSMRTWACSDCATREINAPGVIQPMYTQVVTGCSCASKLIYRRLCAAHRYTLASALIINTLIVHEWKLVNFPPSFCMFCKKVGRHDKGKEKEVPGVFFCANCQGRVADPERTDCLFYGVKQDEQGNPYADPRGEQVIKVIYNADKNRAAGVSSEPQYAPC
ncbi:hypothetical protein F5X68DRAFT_240966 [Plectosphaerella plurivora]|uniref:Zn(2)-C6 fungal-type domain-containing protein n=1 Tax=Plectosphaerella plurivora TaxID=936078 RepID=A0A9P8VAT6_9PEZI|nr:hypothetical protein F5X68DRAFT_240966 [Plectosphaerella plurivora]